MPNQKWLRFLRFWFPVILYSGMIYKVSGIPSLSPPLSWKYADKLFHVGEYTPFGILLGRAIHDARPQLTWGKVVVAVLLGSLLYGISDEFHQSFVPGRQSGMDDVLADTIGGMVGVYLYIWVQNYCNLKRKN